MMPIQAVGVPPVPPQVAPLTKAGDTTSAAGASFQEVLSESVRHLIAQQMAPRTQTAPASSLSLASAAQGGPLHLAIQVGHQVASAFNEIKNLQI